MKKSVISILVVFFLVMLFSCGQDNSANSPKKNFEELVQDLKFGTSSVQVSSARELGKLGNQNAVDPLLPFLQNENPELSIEVAISLGRLRAEAALPELIKMIKQDPYNKKHIFLDVMLGFKDKRVLEALIWNMQNSNDETVKYFAIETIGSLKDKTTIPELLSQFAHEIPKSLISYKILQALSRIEHPDVVPLLITAIEGYSFPFSYSYAGRDFNLLADRNQARILKLRAELEYGCQEDFVVALGLLGDLNDERTISTLIIEVVG